MFNPTLFESVRKLIPDGLYRRLDPFEAAITDFVESTARSTSPGALVLDAGAGECRFRDRFGHTRYLGIDAAFGDEEWDYSGLDVIGRIESLPLGDGSCQRVLSIVVLEHTPDPQKAIAEFYRVLDVDGTAHLVVPHMWEEHQRPHDYFRYTSSGIRILVERAGFEVVRIEPVGGFFWQLGRRLMGVLAFAQTGWRWILFPLLAPIFGILLPLICYYLDGLDRDRAYTLGFLCEARKPGTGSKLPGRV
jgi:SAM-dependent methyltransferase